MISDDAFLRRLPTILNPAQVVQLEALGEFLPLEEVERDLRVLMADVNKRLEEQALAAAAEISKERNILIETLMGNPPGNVVLLLAFDIPE